MRRRKVYLTRKENFLSKHIIVKAGAKNSRFLQISNGRVGVEKLLRKLKRLENGCDNIKKLFWRLPCSRKPTFRQFFSVFSF